MGAISNLEDRLIGARGYTAVQTAAGIGGLGIRTLRLAARPPFSWFGEAMDESANGLRRCIGPLMLSIGFFAIGLVVTTIAGILDVLGTIDRLGGGMALGWPRETGYWVTSMIFAGVVGSALTADLGARKIREELDAFEVLGIDPVRKLVVPRVLALGIIAPILGLLAVFEAILLIYFVAPLAAPNLQPAVYTEGFKSFATQADIISLVLRMFVTGIFVGVVSCYKGLTTSGGAEGVGRAVNQSVVITFVGLWVLNTLWNGAFLAAFPDLQTLRG